MLGMILSLESWWDAHSDWDGARDVHQRLLSGKRKDAEHTGGTGSCCHSLSWWGPVLWSLERAEFLEQTPLDSLLLEGGSHCCNESEAEKGWSESCHTLIWTCASLPLSKPTCKELAGVAAGVGYLGHNKGGDGMGGRDKHGNKEWAEGGVGEDSKTMGIWGLLMRLLGLEWSWYSVKNTQVSKDK